MTVRMPHALRPAMFAALVLGIAQGASASDARTATTPPAFEQLDRNKDERLSRTEAGYNRQLEAMFTDSDVNADGFVTRSEYESATRRIVVSEARR